MFGIVTQAGGTVELDSEPGTGTRVEIVLPATDAPLPPKERTADPTAHSPTDGLVVVLAEDNDDVRQLIARTLQRANMRVHSFANGLDADRFLRNSPGRIDLLVTDIIMPLMGGTSLLEVARSNHPGIKTLFVTGYSDKPLALDKASVHLLQKPLTGRRIIAALDSLLGG